MLLVQAPVKVVAVQIALFPAVLVVLRVAVVAVLAIVQVHAQLHVQEVVVPHVE